MIGKSNGESNNLKITNGTLTDVLTSSGTIQPNTFIEQEEHKYGFTANYLSNGYYQMTTSATFGLIGEKYFITAGLDSGTSTLTYIFNTETASSTSQSLLNSSDYSATAVLPIDVNYVWICNHSSDKTWYKYQITSSGTLNSTGVTTTCDLEIQGGGKICKAHDNIWIYAYPLSSITVQIKILQINSNNIKILSTKEVDGKSGGIDKLVITNTHIFIIYNGNSANNYITVISWSSSANTITDYGLRYIQGAEQVVEIFELSNGKIVVVYDATQSSSAGLNYKVYSISGINLILLANKNFPTAVGGLYYNSLKNQILLINKQCQIYWGEINFSDYSFQGYYQGLLTNSTYSIDSVSIKIIPLSTSNSYIIVWYYSSGKSSYYIKATNLISGLFVKQSSTAINGLSTTTITTSGGKAYLLN